MITRISLNLRSKGEAACLFISEKRNPIKTRAVYTASL